MLNRREVLYRHRKHGPRLVWIIWVLPVGMLICVVGALLLSVLPGLALQAVGFAPQGSVDAFWANQQAQASVPQNSAPVGDTGTAMLPGEDGAVPAPTGYADWFQWANTPDVITIDAGPRGRFTLDSAQMFAETLWIGDGIDGLPLGVMSFREDALGEICDTWLAGCAAEQYRVDRVDFRPGGGVIYGSANFAGFWQDAGLVMTLTSDRAGFDVAGMVLGGTLYAVPTDGDIAHQIGRLVTEGNAVLRQARLITEGYTLAVTEIHLTDDRLTLVLR